MEPIGELGFVSVTIDEKLSLLSSSQSERCIYRVHKKLRMVNEKAYEPEMVAIGPYHRGKEKLQQMEEHKLRYLKTILDRESESSSKKYVMAISSLEQEARQCYDEPINLNPNEMIEMMVLDGCFIVELLMKFQERESREDDDPIFQMGWMLTTLRRDLMLFENQLPFFIICKLYDIIMAPNRHDELQAIALNFFHPLNPHPGYVPRVVEGNTLHEIKHFLGLIHHNWVSSFSGKEHKENEQNETVKWRFIPSATELQEGGVKIEKLESGTLLDIKFKNGILHGVLQIPPFNIEDRTESVFRNLIAYEQYCPHDHVCYITDYLRLLNSLVDSPKDVALLSDCGVIQNWIGDDEVVSKMFKSISDETVQRDDRFLYADIFRRVNSRCQRRSSRWLANLKRNYLNSPWAWIAILVAFAVLTFTAIQTYFSAFPHK